MNVLAIGAHPDDIELQCAGTLALYAKSGHRVFMAVATNGNVGSPTHSREAIAAIRRKEQEASCALIGATLIWMDFDDEWLFNDRPTRARFIDAIREADPAAAGVAFAEGFREVKTYPRTGSFALLPGFGA
jgi:LmbE family N-acetylglucosaminyl deacetylase